MARSRSLYLAGRFGAELRIARVTAGLSQEQLARAAGLGQTAVSRVERGDHRASLEVRCRLAAACGYEIGWRLYPVATVRLRDSGQLALAQAISAAAHASWTVTLEAPIAPGDPRAADMLLAGRDEVLHIEIERALVDAQAQLRSAQLKRQGLAEREPLPIRLVIAVPDSRVARERLEPARELMLRSFPSSPRKVWAAIRDGSPLGGDGILLVRTRAINRRRGAAKSV
ncbi:MAG TPA: helix-turn-helix transcriptional regulator [Candidatus Binatia bacterium]|nr:helix-turn-helix transcriptional regulator [Candidatus Binatia bacterium]